MISFKLFLPLIALALLVAGTLPKKASAAVLTSSSTAQTFLGDPGIDIEKARTRIRERKAQRFNWELGTTLGDYDRVGNKDPRWDADVREMLPKYAAILSGSASALDALPEIKETCRKVMSAGCTDPFISYLAVILECYPTTLSERAAKLAEAEKVVAASKYSEVRKFFTSVRAAQFAIKASGYGKNPAPPGTDPAASLDHAREHFLNVLADPAAPRSAVAAMARVLFHDVCRDNPVGREHGFDPFAKYFGAHPGSVASDPARLLLIEGLFGTEYAWDARTAGWASNVTNEGWKLFEARLADAEKALEAAWEKDPYDPDIAVEMMTVELGQGRGRDRLETWFRRAMDADPDNYAACDQKVLYLEPKWYGSADDVLAFGRECLATANWPSRIPFILLLAHTELAGASDTPQEYWKQPSVWADVKTLYDACLAANPASTFDLSGYAVHAYKAQQWKLADQLFTKLGDNPNLRAMNCSAAEYQQMRLRASTEAKTESK